MTLRPYKFQVIAICQELDEDGRVIGERIVAGQNNQPLEVFGCDGLRNFADMFPAQIEAASNPPDEG